MDVIKACIEEYKFEFTRKLESVGFTRDQARNFLPETATGISGLTENSYIAERMVDLLTTDTSALLSGLNVGAMSDRVGIQPAKVISGLQAITPLLNRILSDKRRSMVDSTATLSWGSGHVLLKGKNIFVN